MHPSLNKTVLVTGAVLQVGCKAHPLELLGLRFCCCSMDSTGAQKTVLDEEIVKYFMPCQIFVFKIMWPGQTPLTTFHALSDRSFKIHALLEKNFLKFHSSFISYSLNIQCIHDTCDSVIRSGPFSLLLLLLLLLLSLTGLLATRGFFTSHLPSQCPRT